MTERNKGWERKFAPMAGAALLVLGLSFLLTNYNQTAVTAETLPPAATDGYIVRLPNRSAETTKQVLTSLQALGSVVEYPQPTANSPHYAVLRPPKGEAAPKLPSTLTVEPNFIYSIERPIIRTDQNFNHWWQDALNLPMTRPAYAAQNFAILDTGCSPHVELPTNDIEVAIANGIISYGQPAAADDIGHATAVKGVMFMVGANPYGLKGVIRRVETDGTGHSPYKIICEKAFNNGSSDSATIALAFSLTSYYSALHGPTLANASFGGPASLVVQDALQGFVDTDNRNIAVIACGNRGSSLSGKKCEYPAQYGNDGVAGVIAVDALDKNLQPAAFTNLGAKFASPGVDICTTFKGPDNYACLAGTSFATPETLATINAILDRRFKGQFDPYHVSRDLLINSYLPMLARKLASGQLLLDGNSIGPYDPKFKAFFPIVFR